MGVANSSCYKKADLLTKVPLPITINIPSNDFVYVGQNPGGPPILSVRFRVELTEGGTKRTIFFYLVKGEIETQIGFFFRVGNTDLFEVGSPFNEDKVKLIGLGPGRRTDTPRFALVGNEIGNLRAGTDYLLGDEYVIIFKSFFLFGNKECNPDTEYFIEFGRGETSQKISVSNATNNPTNNTTNNIKVSNNILKEVEMIEVPIINIEAQTTVENTDIGDAVFSIYDKYQYYGCDINKHVYTNKCRKHYTNNNDILETKFTRTNLKIIRYLKGEGATAKDKVVSLYQKTSKKINVLEFGDNIMTYALIKYILAKLLYGKFCKKYLLNKYHEKFLEDLSKSRFCGGLKIYTDKNSVLYGYNKYFKYDLAE